MSKQLKSDLLAVVRERARSGRGAFQNHVANAGLDPRRMTNAELADELQRAYGAEILDILDEAGVAKFYESDLVATLGIERGRLVAKHRRNATSPPKAATPSARRGNRRKPNRKPGIWTTGAIGLAAFLIVRVITGWADEGQAASLADASSEVSEARQSAASSASDTYEFSSCAQYLGAVSGLRCFSQLGGSRLPADTMDAENARADMARSIRASRWSRNGQCRAFLPQVDGVSFNEANYAFVLMRDTGRPTQESLYNACSSSANTAAYQVCESASGMCEADD